MQKPHNETNHTSRIKNKEFRYEIKLTSDKLINQRVKGCKRRKPSLQKNL